MCSAVYSFQECGASEETLSATDTILMQLRKLCIPYNLTVVYSFEYCPPSEDTLGATNTVVH